MNVLELAGFHSNYGSNFIPALENLDMRLLERGHKTFYIFSNENPSKGFYEWEAPFSEKHDTHLVNFHSASFVAKVAQFIRENHIDVVHAHFCSSIYLSMVKKLSPSTVRFFQQIHTMPYENQINHRAKLKRMRNVLTFDRDITVICISRAMVPIVKYILPRNDVRICINCIDFSRLEKRRFNRNREFRVLLFGYNYYVKGVDVAIRAMLQLAEKLDDVHLDIIMGDNFESNTERIIQEFGKIPDCVSILEPTNDIAPFYHSHTVFLNASRSEGGSYAILEAYYSGALCVLSDVPATRESDLPNAILFRSEDSDSLVAALIEAHGQKDVYENDPEYVASMFSIDQWSNCIIETLGV